MSLFKFWKTERKSEVDPKTKASNAPTSDEDIKKRLDELNQKFSFSDFVLRAVKILPEAIEEKALEQINAAKDNSLVVRSVSEFDVYSRMFLKFVSLLFKDKLLIHPANRMGATEVKISKVDINFYEDGILFLIIGYSYFGSGSTQTGNLNFVTFKYRQKYTFLASKLENLLEGKLENPTDSEIREVKQFYAIGLVRRNGVVKHIAEIFLGKPAFLIFDSQDKAIAYWNVYNILIQRMIDEGKPIEPFEPDLRVIDSSDIVMECRREQNEYILLNPVRNSPDSFSASIFYDLYNFPY